MEKQLLSGGKNSSHLPCADGFFSMENGAYFAALLAREMALVADEVALVGEWCWQLWCGLAEGLLIHQQC